VHATELELFDQKRVVVSAPRPPLNRVAGL
jgi:hypothetical protein